MQRRVSVIAKEDMNRPVREFLSPVEVVLYTDQTIEEAIKVLHQAKIEQKVLYFYVLDRKGQLKGAVSTRSLVLNTPDTLVSSVMGEINVFLLPEQNLREAMHLMEKYRLLDLPVIDERSRFLGVINVEIYFDDTIQKIHGLVRKDIFQFIGIKIEEGKVGTAWKGYKARMPWLFCNVGSGLVCAVIAKLYQVVLAKLLILAMFIPLVLTICESVSMQAMTQSLSILRASHVHKFIVHRRIWLEVKTVFFLSLSAAVVVGLISLLWGEGMEAAYIIGVALFIAIIVASIVGMIIPLALHACRLDPKLAAGPVILMIVDVVGTAIYYSLAFFWILE